jgi:hypothetical protein
MLFFFSNPANVLSCRVLFSFASRAPRCNKSSLLRGFSWIDSFLSPLPAIAFRNVQAPDGNTCSFVFNHAFVLMSFPLGSNSVLASNGVSIIPELQFARCMSARYKDELFTRCVACTRRWAGDTCRFQGIRYIVRDQHQKYVGISFNEHTELTETQKMEFPRKWNRKLERKHIQRLKVSSCLW